MTKCLPLTRFPTDRQVTFRGLRLTTTWRPAGLYERMHTHDLTSLAFCPEGPFEETFGKHWRQVGTRSLLVRPGGGPHANRYPGQLPSRTLIIELLPETLEVIRCETRILDTPGHFDAPRFAVLGRRLDLESRDPDGVTPLAIEALLYELIVSITRRARADHHGKPPWLGRVRDYLHSSFTHSISLADLATTVGVHPSHLAKTFRRTYGFTIGEYVRQLRIEYSETLLRQRRLSLAEIAITCGFHDQSHFTRVFVEVFGISPGRYASAQSVEQGTRLT